MRAHARVCVCVCVCTHLPGGAEPTDSDIHQPKHNCEEGAQIVVFLTAEKGGEELEEKEIEVTVNNYQYQTCKVCHSLACHFDELADNLNTRLQVLNSAHLRHCPELHLIESVQEAVEVGGDLAELVLPKDMIHILTLCSVHQGRRGEGRRGGDREGEEWVSQWQSCMHYPLHNVCTYICK